MQTVPGGCYKNPQGDGYHDAHGRPIPPAKVAEYLKANAATASRVHARSVAGIQEASDETTKAKKPAKKKTAKKKTARKKTARKKTAATSEAPASEPAS